VQAAPASPAKVPGVPASKATVAVGPQSGTDAPSSCVPSVAASAIDSPAGGEEELHEARSTKRGKRRTRYP
jgi:hypothetical protein